MKVEISKRNIITNVEQWHQFAPPKDSDKHWKEGRSAMSLAQFMTNSKQIKKLEDLLKEWGYEYITDIYGNKQIQICQVQVVAETTTY